MAFYFGAGFWITLGWLIGLLGMLWIANPQHRRTRRLLSPPCRLMLGIAIRARLVK